MNTKTQNAVLLSELKKRNLTVYKIMNELGIGCPTKRISELKKKHPIKINMVKKKTRWGTSTFAVYVLQRG